MNMFPVNVIVQTLHGKSEPLFLHHSIQVVLETKCTQCTIFKKHSSGCSPDDKFVLTNECTLAFLFDAVLLHIVKDDLKEGLPS